MYSFHKFISDFSFRRKFFGAVIVTLAYRNAQKRSVAARKRDRWQQLWTHWAMT